MKLLQWMIDHFFDGYFYLSLLVMALLLGGIIWQHRQPEPSSQPRSTTEPKELEAPTWEPHVFEFETDSVLSFE